MQTARRVAVYRSALLPASETFIRAQALALRRWQPVLVGDQRVERGLPLEGLRHVTADAGLAARRLRRVDGWLERCAGLSLAMRATLAREHPWLVHAHFGLDGVRVWPTARSLALPLVVTLHGYDIMIDERHWEQQACWRQRRYPARLRALAREPRVHFVAVSEPIRQKAVRFGIPPEKIDVAHIGVELEAFRPRGASPAERARRILYVGRLVEKKGAPLLLEALSRVMAEVPDVELVIAGEGPLEGSLRAMAAERRLPVRFLGAISTAEVREQLHEARLFCLPSIIAASGDGEGLPIVLLEAQAAGLPVVTSAQGGEGEAMLHGETGLAFAPGDVEALSAHLVRLLGDDALCARMGARARAHVAAHFDIGACTRKLEAIYDRALSRS